MSATNPVQTLLSRLHKVKATGSHQWTARCPAHDDKGPSLSVSHGHDGRALVHRFAGCSTEAIVAAINMSVSELFAGGGASPTYGNGRLTRDDADRLLHNCGLRHETIEAFGIVPDLQAQAWRIPIGTGAKLKLFEPTSDTNKCKWAPRKPRDGTADVYGLDRLPEGALHTWLVEGEPDVWIAQQAGLNAVSFTAGASSVPEAGVAALVAAGIGAR